MLHIIYIWMLNVILTIEYSELIMPWNYRKHIFIPWHVIKLIKYHGIFCCNMSKFSMNVFNKCHLDLVPRICPTTRLEMPMPIICTDVARPIAVPSVACGTTRGIEGHILAYKKHIEYVHVNVCVIFSISLDRCVWYSQQQMNKWCPARWLIWEEGQKWRPGVQTQAESRQHTTLRTLHADPHNPVLHNIQQQIIQNTTKILFFRIRSLIFWNLLWYWLFIFIYSISLKH